MKPDEKTPEKKPAFSYPVRVGHISVNAVAVYLEADAAERKALAELWDILEVRSLVADLQIARWKKDGVRVRGQVTADLVQACVVTLEPVAMRIEEPLEVIYVPEDSKLARIVAADSAEMFVDPDGPDLPEVFAGDTIDVGETVAEHAALAIEPYPKAPGAAFAPHVESTAKDDVRPNPFTVLKDWKKE